MHPLQPLGRIDADNRSAVGGKAAGLARLAAAGLPVPGAFVVPSMALEEAARAAGIDLSGDPPAVAAALRTVPLPSGWAGRWSVAARKLGGRLAVRSSAADEDGAEKSFAGQHRTELGVRPHEVPDAIRRVWASLYEAPAVAYRGRPGGQMAVVVQEQVDAEVSGVLFTVNPLNGSWREMVVEAVWGQGEGLVSGQIAPHWYLVRRPHRLPGPIQRVWSRVRLAEMQADLPELTERMVLGENGQARREATPSALRRRRTLERRRLLKLCRLGLKVERLLGAPQDVEWCVDRSGRIRLLQTRPITRAGSERPRTDVVYTRRFIGERWPDPVSPMGWSILQPIFDHFIAYPGVQDRYLGGGPALKLVRGRPYLNTTVFRHLAFKLPGSPAPRFMAELLPPEEERAWRGRRAFRPDFAVYAAILKTTAEERRWERFAFNPLTNPDVWDAWRATLEDRLPAWEQDPDSLEAALRRIEEQVAWITDYTGIHVCSLLFANLLYQLLDGALAAWVPQRRAALMEALAVCPPGNRTLMANAALWELGQAATEADLDALRDGGREPSDFSEGFGPLLADFLDAYGHRSEASWEICAPRWGDDPGRLVALLRSQRSVGARDPGERAADQEARFERALEEVEALPPLRRAVLLLLVRYVRRYLLLRENQRFWFDHLLTATQRSLLAAGDGLVDRGALDRAEDVRWLTWPELQGIGAGTLDPGSVPEWVARRRAERAEDAATEPPVFLVGDEGRAAVSAGRRLTGLGISPGRARGRVRVIPTLDDGHRLEPGDVLVTRSVDPGWTPLFASAGAVVLELGGMLSHGAVVAREYQVPMVVNLEGGNQRLVDGLEVTVDGTRGVVWIHP